MHQPESTLALTLRWPASTFRGNKQREILKSSSGMKTFDLQAFALHGSRCMLTHFSHFSGANIATKHLQPTSIDDAAWIPGQRSGLADMLAYTYRGARMARNLCFKGAFVENYTHPCIIAARHLPCSRPPDVLICNTYCTFERVRRTTTPDTQQRRQPQASSMEGYSVQRQRCINLNQPLH